MRFRFLSPPFHLLFPLSDGNSSRRRYQTGIEKGIHQFIYRHLSLLDALQCSPCVCVDNNNNNIYILSLSSSIGLLMRRLFVHS
jgi:hypothetical protein